MDNFDGLECELSTTNVPTVTMVVSPAAVVLTHVPTDLGVLREICRAFRCGARVALTGRGVCDLIGACASRYPSLSCPFARLVRAATFPSRRTRRHAHDDTAPAHDDTAGHR